MVVRKNLWFAALFSEYYFDNWCLQETLESWYNKKMENGFTYHLDVLYFHCSTHLKYLVGKFFEWYFRIWPARLTGLIIRYLYVVGCESSSFDGYHE